MKSYCVHYNSLIIGQAPDEEKVDAMIAALENKVGKNHIAERQYWFTIYHWHEDREESIFAIHRDYEE